MIYGTTHRPIEELIQRRYNKQAFTIATSNYNLDTLRKKYSDFVADRLKQMLNVIILDGKSRRK
jgi:DNA replication protein DnaC